LSHRDRYWKLLGKECRAARVWNPCKRRDAVRGASSSNREAAGRFWPSATLLVSHYMRA